MTDFLTRKDWSREPDVASVFDEVSFWSSRFGALLFEHIEIRRDLDILDVGCATGFPLFELAHTFGRSCRVTGVDTWKEALERARLKLRVYDSPNVSICEADGARLPFPDAAFDLIVSNLGVNNFADPPAVLQECQRVAKPLARIVLTTNPKGHMREFYEQFQETLRDAGRDDYIERLGANENHRGTEESACELLRGAGFRIVKVIRDSFELRYQDGSAMFNHPLTQLGFLGGWRSVVDPEDESGIFGRLEDQLNRISRAGGGLRMTIPMLYLEGEKQEQG